MNVNDIYSRKVMAALAILFSLIGIGIYSNVLTNGIFLFDDYEYIIDNPLIQSFSNFSLSDSRQIGYLSFMINYAIGGESPFGFHVVNVAIHILNALLVVLLIQRVTRILCASEECSEIQNNAVAALAGLLFLTHPIQTQSVSYITQRFASLSTLFYLLGIHLYFLARMRFEQSRDSTRGYLLYSVALLAVFLGMRTKETTFTIPFMLLLIEVTLFQRSVLGRRRFIYVVPFLALLAVIPITILGPEWGLTPPGAGIAEVTRREKIYDLVQRPFLEYFFTQFRVIVTYLRLLILPIGLRVIYDLNVSRSLLEPATAGSLIFLCLLFGGGILLWRRASVPGCGSALDKQLIAIGIMWFFITISVESSVIPIKDLIFEHRTYLPSVGFFLVEAVSILWFVRLLTRKPLTVRHAAIAIGLVAIALSVATYVRNDIWTNEVTFWDDVVRKTPTKAIGYNNRGNAYARSGQYELALADMNRTISHFPLDRDVGQLYELADFSPANMAKSFMNRAEVLDILGYHNESETDLSRARVLISRGSFNMQESLQRANYLMKRGNYRQAIDELNRILLLAPDNIDALNDRANAYSWTSNYRDAIRDFDRIIAMAPEKALSYHNRGIAYAWKGDKGKALLDFQKACDLGFQPACDSMEKVKPQH